MPSMGVTGEISEVSRSGGRVCLEWRIRRFLQLPCESWDDYYESPRFSFCDACWCMGVFLSNLSGRVSLFLRRCDEAPSPKTVHVSVGLKGSDGGEEKREEVEREFRNGGCWSLCDICTRGELSEQGMMQDDALVIACHMETPGYTDRDASTHREAEFEESRIPLDDKESSEKRDASTQTEAEFKESRISLDDKESSEKRGIEKVAEDMGKLLVSGKKSDVTVQVKEVEFRVHSHILCARSPVLSAMLEHDTAERASNNICINDCEPDVFEEYLRYVYTGTIQSFSQKTVFDLYNVADKYLAEDLKLLCLQHVQNTISVQTFCDTVKLALMHGESELLQLAIDFATNNFQAIVISVEWQNFNCEYPREANEILVKCFGPKR